MSVVCSIGYRTDDCCLEECINVDYSYEMGNICCGLCSYNEDCEYNCIYYYIEEDEIIE